MPSMSGALGIRCIHQGTKDNYLKRVINPRPMDRA
jgi:hypothetical protein